MKYPILNKLDIIYFETIFASLSSFMKIVSDIYDSKSEMLSIPFSYELLTEAVNANQGTKKLNEINGYFIYSPKCAPLLTVLVHVGYGGGGNPNAICMSLNCQLLRIRSTTRNNVTWPIQEFCLEDRGSGKTTTKRFVRVMRDDPRWEFLEEGEPLPIENQENYKKRCKKDRLTSDDVINMAVACGVPFDNSKFYESADGLMYFWTTKST